MQTIRITNVPVLFTCSTELRQPLLRQCFCWAQFYQVMDEEQIKELVNKLVEKRIKEEKQKLADKVQRKFEYTGEYAKAYYLMEVIKDWSRS